MATNDEDVAMFDTPATVAGTTNGKGVASSAQIADSLPWCVSSHGAAATADAFYRVEKYRPVSLDDVVSHKDITTTSA